MHYLEDRKMSLAENEHNRVLFITGTTFSSYFFFFSSWKREEKADRNKGDKRGVYEMKGKKESCPGSSSIHLVSDICFFIAT